MIHNIYLALRRNGPIATAIAASVDRPAGRPHSERALWHNTLTCDLRAPTSSWPVARRASRFSCYWLLASHGRPVCPAPDQFVRSPHFRPPRVDSERVLWCGVDCNRAAATIVARIRIGTRRQHLCARPISAETTRRTRSPSAVPLRPPADLKCTTGPDRPGSDRSARR